MAEEELPAARPLKPLFSVGSRKTAGGFQSLAAETAVALSYGGSSLAVLMATPADLVDLAYGFSLTEGIACRPDEILGVETVPFASGIDLQIALAEDRSAALAARRRSMAGPVGCGLCGLESIDAAMRPVPIVEGDDFTMSTVDVDAAVTALSQHQPLFAQTRAVHGAGFFRPGTGMLAVREDVGRHNALDKLIGALSRKEETAARGAFVVTSRLSVEMVQKAAIAGAPVLIAVSQPTALAVETAERAGITLVASARGDGFSVFSHGRRITH
ncbi:formate dehydrogenase accessory sulfurtransferase FdhD [Martelella lutilitoris]|uniref:Sulfur carrier protein FdhD n=1 Tax=Martelella lutilitoris TaxID=2583532 RepID=A0A5C4JVL5_9HYPH|nr:formate dehydrogenase accessory sulfurtransferase FdhD [Martelella lutilitoris]TNB49508.1 formate dehydrogenase accessory sulfurtransferase FdhD [Martelella lutilitoris]